MTIDISKFVGRERVRGKQALMISGMPEKKQHIRIEREWAMPSPNTFEIKPIRKLIDEEMCNGIWIDPFANQSRIADITNDINPKHETDFHMDALDFLKEFPDNSIDGVLYDPPYSPRQVAECYKGVGRMVNMQTTQMSFWRKQKVEIARILKKGGKVLSFGWNTGGIGKKYGFEITRILMVAHGGFHNDTLCTVELKMEDVQVSDESVENQEKRFEQCMMI